MQDDDKTPLAPADTDAPPSSHDHMNRPGMTNGIPDQADEGQATGSPTDDRQQSENATKQDDASEQGGGADGGAGS